MPGQPIIWRDGPVSVPLNYTVPASSELLPVTVEATINGAAAAVPFFAVVQVLDPSGKSVGKYRSEAIAAGGSADCTWFPGIGGTSAGGTQSFVGARIQATSTQSVSDSTNTNLVYQSVLFDTDGMANLGSDNRILTVNTAGIYLVVVCTQWAANGAGRRINAGLHNAYYTDGSIPDVDSQASNANAVYTPIPSSTGRSSNTSVGIYQAAVGDFFSSGAYQGSGVALNANGFDNCFLSAALIGA